MTKAQEKAYDGTHKRNYPVIILIGLGMLALGVFCFMRFWDLRTNDPTGEDGGGWFIFAIFLLPLALIMIWVNAKAWYMELLFGKVKIELASRYVRCGEQLNLSISVQSEQLSRLHVIVRFVNYQRRHKSPAEIESEKVELDDHYEDDNTVYDATSSPSPYEDTVLIDKVIKDERGSTDKQGRFSASLSYEIPNATHPTERIDDKEYFSDVQYEIRSGGHKWRGEERLTVSKVFVEL